MRRRTRAVAGNLAALKAETAAKFVGPDEISEVPVAAIHAGDIVLLRPGERCAVDGTVIEGRSEIDQSLITGETLYVTAEQGTPVYAGIAEHLRHACGSGSRPRPKARCWPRSPGCSTMRCRRARAMCGSPTAPRGSMRRWCMPPRSLTMLGWVSLGAGWHDAIVTGDRRADHHLSLRARARDSRRADGGVRRDVPRRRPAQFRRRHRAARRSRPRRLRQDRHADLPDLEVVNAADIPADVFALAGRLALASRHPVAAAVARASDAKSPLSARSKSRARACAPCVDGVELRLGRPSFCGAERLANDMLSLDPEASVVAFSRGDDKYHVLRAPGACVPMRRR